MSDPTFTIPPGFIINGTAMSSGGAGGSGGHTEGMWIIEYNGTIFQYYTPIHSIQVQETFYESILSLAK